jgi:hypothetical protein
MNNYNRKQRKYYGKETSKWDEEANTNSSKRRQGNRVTVSGDEYNLCESDRRTTNDYDRKQASREQQSVIPSGCSCTSLGRNCATCCCLLWLKL